MDRKKKQQWIVDSPSDLYSVDKDLEKYLNRNPYPGYELFQVVLTKSQTNLYTVIWKLYNG